MKAADTFSGLSASKGAPLLERLMKRVHPEPNSGCWIWTGNMQARGYGMAYLPGGKLVGAHRAMLIAHGAVLSDGDVVCHRCDMPWCVNPDHLFIGKQSDNLADMARKGRASFSNHALPIEAREFIRTQGLNVLPRLLAWWFGVSPATIRNIRANRSWKQTQ